MALLSVAEALRRVLESAEALPPERVPVLEAHGRILADTVAALRTQPPADLSAMDGYAVRAADIIKTPARLKLIGEVAAGHAFDKSVTAGEAARIFTGGLVPPGADTIVIQENTQRERDEVIVTTSAPPRKHVRAAGLDFQRGQALLEKGRQLTARDLMLAAAMNHPVLPVHRRPKVAVLATGDELVPPGTTPGPAEIVYSNGFGLLATARQEGAEIIDLGIAPDRMEETIAAVRRARALGADILVTSGGASVGDHDLVQRAFASEGMALSFWKVALRPGRPLMHGRLGAMHGLGLPGNPVSAYVCAVLFLIPLIRRLSGRTDLSLPMETAILGQELPANDERTDYLRAGLRMTSKGATVYPFAAQDSSMITPLAKADCLLVREPFAPPANVGDACAILRLPG
ncbi:MAG TPA: gephyrin-like molybdotransferase Glp [Xanthobacteraceae bacterium]